MMLAMIYFRAELVQLIVSQSDSELEVQRYSMKKNTLTVDPIMLQDELWMRQCEKPSPNRRSLFFKLNCENWVLNLTSVRFGSVFRKLISDSFIGFRTPLPVCRLRGANCGSLDVSNVKTMQTGSCDICWWSLRELDEGKIRRRPGMTVSEETWRVLVCPVRTLRVVKNGVGESGGNHWLTSVYPESDC